MTLVAPSFCRETLKLENIRLLTFAMRTPPQVHASIVRKLQFNAYSTNDVIFQHIGLSSTTDMNSFTLFIHQMCLAHHPTALDNIPQKTILS